MSGRKKLVGIKRRVYEVKSGKYKGLYHVRDYLGNGKYYHVGRYTKEEAYKLL